jgi:Mn2+/Fe2+ NRAMP family transporter
MQIDNIINGNVNIYLALGISIIFGAIVGFIRAVKYSLSHRVTIDKLSAYYDKGDYENIRNKRKDKKVMMITGVIIAFVVALIIIITTFVTFNK